MDNNDDEVEDKKLYKQYLRPGYKRSMVSSQTHNTWKRRRTLNASIPIPNNQYREAEDNSESDSSDYQETDLESLAPRTETSQESSVEELSSSSSSSEQELEDFVLEGENGLDFQDERYNNEENAEENQDNFNADINNGDLNNHAGNDDADHSSADDEGPETRYHWENLIFFPQSQITVAGRNSHVLDSSSKIPSGILIGNIIELGMYDECMSVYVNKNGTDIRGNHCSYVIYLSYKNKSLPINPVISTCLPLSCNSQDLRKLLLTRIHDTGAYKLFNITNVDVLCSDKHTQTWTGTILTGLLLGMIFILLLICTILDLIKRKKLFNNYIPRICSEISLYKSTVEIFSLTEKSDSFLVLHGLRFFSTSIIILAHSILIRAVSSHANNLDLAYLPPWFSVGIALALYTVDTFLIISGFLMCHSFLKKYSPSTSKFKLSTYYIHRYIRLTPTIIATLLITTYIAPILGSGPKWQILNKDFLHDSCTEKWWTILLYMNNIFLKDCHCLPHLWSAAVDMQLFWLSPIILYPLAKIPKLGLSILSMLLIASIVAPAAVIAMNNFPFSMYQVEGCFTHLMNMFKELYTQPYTRASPWLVGILLGYLEINGPKTLSKTAVRIGWLMTAVSLLFCFTGFWIITEIDYVYNVYWESVFGAISRPIWAVAMGWIIFASVRGYGGVINRFLSSPVFFPLSRLSFSSYVVSVTVLMLKDQSFRIPTYFIYFEEICSFLNSFLIILIVAYILCIFCEIPARLIEKFLLFGHAVEYGQQEKNSPELNKQKVS